ncbi:hypothetical protein HDU89_002412 [Geranomyces variabilis]|nr:hypothetical protein HDU89_002412 [Geranomyces variabilis]
MSDNSAAAATVPTATGSNPASAPSSAPGSAPSSAPGTPRSSKSNAPRCSKDGCTDRAVKIIGDCRYCAQKYCGKHRLPEAHMCDNLQKCRDQSAENLKSRLLGEKCVAEKV